MAIEPNEHEEDFLNEHEDDAEEAKGGPVDQPAPSKPMGPPSKGKISAQTAKRIWFICIGVSVLAIAAVVVDYVFDLRGVRGPGEDPNANAAPVAPRPKTKRELSEKEKLAIAFEFATHEKHQKMRESRAYDMVRLAINDARKAGKAAVDDRDNGELWQDAWTKYYDARYKLELFRFRWPCDNAKTPMVGALDDKQAILQLEEEELKSEEAQSHLASKLHYDFMYSELSKIQDDWRGLAKADTVKTENEQVKAARQKWENARDNGVFDEADKEAANREPRGDDEPPPYLE